MMKVMLVKSLTEYVVTDELLKHFHSFFEAYNAGINGNTEKMGSVDFWLFWKW